MAVLTRKDLQQIATARLRDAKALLKTRRFDGGVYLCGYAVEIALKARICRTIGWEYWPEKGEYRTFLTHNLDVLLNLSGRETRVKSSFAVQWSIVAQWNPESRYSPAGKATETALVEMIAATEDLLKVLK